MVQGNRPRLEGRGSAVALITHHRMPPAGGLEADLVRPTGPKLHLKQRPVVLGRKHLPVEHGPLSVGVAGIDEPGLPVGLGDVVGPGADAL
jgi:hypothetical protein